MEAIQYDVILVSCFGRAHWMASELSQKGLNVALIDVTSNLGRWSVEDGEGPFGYFESTSMTASQKTRLVQDQETIALTKGFSFWLSDGPMELKSQLTPFFLKSRDISPDIETFLTENSGASSPGKQSILNAISSKPFIQHWLVRLAFQIFSPRFLMHNEELKGEALPLLNSYFLRRPNRPAFEKSLSDLKAEGIELIAQAKVTDISLTGKKFEALEVTSKVSGAVRGQQLVWTLTSEETAQMSGRMASKLFPFGLLRPQWFWAKYRFSFQATEIENTLPAHFVVVDRLELPWTHENLLIIVQSAQKDNFDIWLKLPYHQRLSRKYLEEMRDRILELLKKKMPQVLIQCLVMPIEYQYDDSEAGAPRFPIFKTQDAEEFRAVRSPFIHLNSPETWMNYDWSSQLKSQNNIVEKIQIQFNRFQKEKLKLQNQKSGVHP